MSRFYYDDLKTDYRTDYLERSPRKAEALNSASVEGKVTILPNSGNRAITIETDEDVYLQSYGTLILRKEKQTGKGKEFNKEAWFFLSSSNESVTNKEENK